LITGRYPGGLFDLLVGINRWLYRVLAYVANLCDTYPPFRLIRVRTSWRRSLPLIARAGPSWAMSWRTS
jgi:hypothetical protein